MMLKKNSKIALLSCSGDLPVKVYETLKKQGHDIVIIGLKEVKSLLKVDIAFSMGQVGKMFYYLQKNKIQDFIFAGAMNRPDLWKLKFDFKGLSLAFKLIRFLRQGDDALLRYICNYFKLHNIKIWSISQLCPNLLMPNGILGASKLDHKTHKRIFNSIDYGRRILNQLAPFDVGQSIIVSDQVVVAIEAIDGTDAMINKLTTMDKNRLQSLSQPIFIKMRKKNQSDLVDLPTIGVHTIEMLAQANIQVAAIEANGCLILDIDKVTACAKKYQITLIGFNNHD